MSSSLTASYDSSDSNSMPQSLTAPHDCSDSIQPPTALQFCTTHSGTESVSESHLENIGRLLNQISDKSARTQKKPKVELLLYLSFSLQEKSVNY